MEAASTTWISTLGTLNMAQKLVSQAHALGSALNQTRNIRHDEARSALKIHHAQIRVQCGEMIVGDLRLRIGHTG